jgi:hypothetical protein
MHSGNPRIDFRMHQCLLQNGFYSNRVEAKNWSSVDMHSGNPRIDFRMHQCLLQNGFYSNRGRTAFPGAGADAGGRTPSAERSTRGVLR